MDHSISRRGALIAGTALLATPLVARAQAPRLRFTLDWAFPVDWFTYSINNTTSHALAHFNRSNTIGTTHYITLFDIV